MLHEVAHTLPFSIAVMRWSETITIYLSVGAPFAVSYFLHQTSSERRAHLLLKTIAAGLLWPLVMLKVLLSRQRCKPTKAATASELLSQQHEEKIEAAKREVLAAVHVTREAATEAFGKESEKLERAACVLRDSIEKYVGLAQTVESAAHDAPPSERELELFRIAGRKGDDLMLAGKCLHRRNVMRLTEHYTRSRADLLHALADIGEAAGEPRQALLANASAAHRLSIATLRLYSHAINLLSLMEDEGAAMSVAQLLNQECTRLRRLQAADKMHAPEQETGEELCATHMARPSHAQLSCETTLAQG
jgi:hypothetical protein